MPAQFPITVYGLQAFQLEQVPYSGPLFFARCWKCSRLDWKFGCFNGWNLCSKCLEEKLIEVGVLKKEHAPKEEDNEYTAGTTEDKGSEEEIKIMGPEELPALLLAPAQLNFLADIDCGDIAFTD